MHHTIDTETDAPKRYQCRHIFTDGHRCGSPCLRGEHLCYYHHTTRKPAPRTHGSSFELPLPEDRSAIQASIGQVLQRIAANDIDPRRAGLLLYGLQIASLNLPKPPAHRKAKPEPIELVEEITTDPELGILAPRTELSERTERPSVIGNLIMKIMQNDEPARPAQEKNILPTLNAEAAPLMTPHKDTASPPSPRSKAPRAPSFTQFAKGGMYAASTAKSRRATQRTQNTRRKSPHHQNQNQAAPNPRIATFITDCYSFSTDGLRDQNHQRPFCRRSHHSPRPSHRPQLRQLHRPLHPPRRSGADQSRVPSLRR